MTSLDSVVWETWKVLTGNSKKIIPEDVEGMKTYMKENELSKYFPKNQKSKYESALKTAIDKSFDKYGRYLNRPVARTAEAAFEGLNKSADGYMAYTKDFIGGGAGKIGAFLGKVGATAPTMFFDYMWKTGDYLGPFKLLGLQAISLIPGVSFFVDSSMTGLVKRRMAYDIKQNFLKEINAYNPVAPVQRQYPMAKNREKNIWKPKPIPQYAN